MSLTDHPSEETLRTTYGLVGYPVGHSLSPLMHNTAFRELRIDAVYRLFSIEPEALDDFFRSLRDGDSPIFGLNVTVPYKERAVAHLDSLSPFARKAGAVNTIVVSKQRRLAGYNTDGPGFLAHLAEEGYATAGRRVALMGAGGAARAIVSALCLFDAPPEVIRVFDIDRDRTQALITDLGSRFDVSRVKPVESVDDLNIELADLLINATPIGLKAGDPCLVEEERLHPDMLVYDLIYNPPETPLLRLARRKGARGLNGLGMLFYQGVLAFQHWADMELPAEVRERMRESLMEGAWGRDRSPQTGEEP